MSWSLSVDATPKDDVAAAIDAARVTGQSLDLRHVARDVRACRGLAKDLSELVKRDRVAVSITGHTLQEDEAEANYHDGFTISVHGVD